MHDQNSPDDEIEDGSSIYDEDLMATLIQEFTQIGEVTLVRYVGETMWVTFRDGQSALAAVKRHSACVCGVMLHFKLKTEDWITQVEQEIELCTTNTVQLCNNYNASVIDYNCLGIPKLQPQRPKSSNSKMIPPTRPPLPKSPTSSPKHTTKAGIISVIPNVPPNSQFSPCVLQKKPSTLPSCSNTVTPNEMVSSTHLPETSAIYEEIHDDSVRIFILFVLCLFYFIIICRIFQNHGILRHRHRL